MVTRSVEVNGLKAQRGFSLIELLVASSLGLIILASVGSVFLSGHNMAVERTKQLMLAQDVNDAIQFIKTDAQRAGFNANNTGSLVLSGATSTFAVPAAKDMLSYIYEDESNKWRAVKFRVSGAPITLQMCVNAVSKGIATMPTDATCSRGTVSNLIDPSYFTVSDFTVTPTPLVTSGANSTLLNVSLTVLLTSSSYSKTVSTKIKARNWN